MWYLVPDTWYHIPRNPGVVAVVDEKIVRGHTLIILSPCHQGNHYILTLRKYYLQDKLKGAGREE